MSRATISVSKFVGSISLGLLTGISYSLSTFTVPSLLALPSATTAHHSFSRLRDSGARHLRTLSIVSGVSFLLAYTLSPRQGRHPYLLWTASMVALSVGGDVYLTREEQSSRQRRRRGEEVDSPANGEEVRKGMERFQLGQAVRTGFAGVGFLMSIVGLWGDGF
ncbi:MAG: Poly [ADP-ribose] polymerase 1 [Chaenotheca gracillima]|nr:MAG: Poly [ADP-ribose] polymerase 1 [Chaenotheca gracillima]